MLIVHYVALHYRQRASDRTDLFDRVHANKMHFQNFPSSVTFTCLWKPKTRRHRRGVFERPQSISWQRITKHSISSRNTLVYTAKVVLRYLSVDCDADGVLSVWRIPHLTTVKGIFRKAFRHHEGSDVSFSSTLSRFICLGETSSRIILRSLWNKYIRKTN